MLRTAIAGFIGVLVGAAVVGVATSQQEEVTAKVVRAERFEVVDAKGEVRAVLAVREDGTPHLALFDADGQVRAIVAVLPSGTPDLYLCDADGKPRASLAVWEDGPSLTLRDAKGKDRATLELSRDWGPILWLDDAAGKTRLELGLGLPDGNPILSLADKEGTTRATLGATSTKTLATGVVHQRPESSLVLSDKEGNVLWQAP